MGQWYLLGELFCAADLRGPFVGYVGIGKKKSTFLVIGRNILVECEKGHRLACILFAW